jgi:PAS domain S-box-containing protein
MTTVGNERSGFDSTETIRDVLEAVPNGLVMIDARGTIVLVNVELERMFGYARSALIGRSIEMLLPERFQGGHVVMRTGYLQAAERRSMGKGRELFARRMDGSEFPIEIGLSSIEGPEGQLAIASVVDISARREVETTFRNIVNAAPYGMLMVDETGKILVSNPYVARIFGYSQDELLGASTELLMPERYRIPHLAQRSQYAQAPRERAMGLNRDVMGRHKDGSEFPVEIGLSPVQWCGRTAVLAAVVDITERKRLELELREANAHLEEFTYVASHDLKAPLRGISDLVEWVGEDLAEAASPETRHNLQRIRTRVSRMERLIQDLLAYARSRDTTAPCVSIAPKQLVEDVVELAAAPSTFNVRIEVEAQDFKAARTPLETVLRNLITNAVKHHDRSDGQILVRVTDEGAYCHIEISDDGPGIPSRSQERVFKLFQTISGDRAGTGIGLALAKRLVESHGGRIELASTDAERGCTFHVWWPRFERRH